MCCFSLHIMFMVLLLKTIMSTTSTKCSLKPCPSQTHQLALWPCGWLSNRAGLFPHISRAACLLPSPPHKENQQSIAGLEEMSHLRQEAAVSPYKTPSPRSWQFQGRREAHPAFIIIEPYASPSPFLMRDHLFIGGFRLQIQ